MTTKALAVPGVKDDKIASLFTQWDENVDGEHHGTPMLTPATPLKPPRPGVYLGVPEEVYHQLGALNQSTLKKLEPVPEVAWQALYEPEEKEKKQEFEFGGAFHVLLFQRDKAQEMIGVAESTDKRLKGVKEALEEMRKRFRYVVSKDDMERMTEMARGVARNKTAQALVCGPGPGEVTMVWVDPKTRMLCKGRIDKLFAGWKNGMLQPVDYKSTSSADHRAFGYSCSDFGYDVQQASYLFGGQVLGLPLMPPLLVVQEKGTSLTAVRKFASQDLVAATDEYLARVRRFRDLWDEHGSERWPGYPDTAEDIVLPEFRRNKKA